MIRMKLNELFKSKSQSIINICKNVAPNNIVRVQCMASQNVAKNLRETDSKFRDTFKPNEKYFLLKLRNDPDTFGSPENEECLDEGDINEEKFSSEKVAASQKLTTKQYADLIKNYIDNRKIKEAIDVLEIKMIQEDGVKPVAYIYNLLLGACGRVGYTDKAFKLYNKMRNRGLEPIAGTFTALFNACANSPWPETDGLTRANHLRQIIREKGYNLNIMSYNAMIKAYGRCGDLATAFSIVDEMISKKLPIKNETLNFLLQACISNKEAGYRHALLVWRKFITRKIPPALYSYNLMLRCIRDCGLGDVKVTEDVLKQLIGEESSLKTLEIEDHENTLLLQVDNLNNNEESAKSASDVEILHNLPSANKLQLFYTKDNKLNLGNSEHKNSVAVKESLRQNTTNVDLRPNLMAPVPHLGNIISISEVKRPQDRLLLVGGASSFLQNMELNKCKPDIVTFTQLLDCIPNTTAAEGELLHVIKQIDVKPDVDFFNMLMKKRSLRFDYDGAREVLILLKQKGYRPDLITYGVLALGCRTKDEALELIREIKLGRYRLNTEILGAMLHTACYHYSTRYIICIMDLCVSEKVSPNKKFMERLNKFYKENKEKLYAKELAPGQEKNFKIFRKRYKEWLQEVYVDDSENVHPWQQFKETSANEYKYKPKDSARFKPIRASKFRVKTSTKVRY